MNKEDIEAQVVAELATMEACLVGFERSLTNLLLIQEQVQQDPTSVTPADRSELEREIAQLRKDIKAGRVSQETYARTLATGDWKSPNAPVN